LCYVLPKIEKVINTKLYPTYAYARLYEKGSELKKHKDRISCEISTTLNLGGDEWPIYIESNPNLGVITNNSYIPSKSKGLKVVLKPGDMLLYKGNVLEHWRKKFNKDICGQVFLHYNEIKDDKKENLFDKRVHLGLPQNLIKLD
jgi:hypothetical protein